MIEKKIFRVIDVNINRCKEGLRVVEDILRFVIEEDVLRRKARKIRHVLDTILQDRKLTACRLAARDAEKDIGKAVDRLELTRKNVDDIFYVNIQRIKESLRVLEEFFKIVDRKKVPLIKKSRYQTYEIERKTHARQHGKPAA